MNIIYICTVISQLYLNLITSFVAKEMSVSNQTESHPTPATFPNLHFSAPGT